MAASDAACAVHPPNNFPRPPPRCVVTGGSGFVGQRLVEMLLERGAESVVSFDIAPRPRDASADERITYIRGNIAHYGDVHAALAKADCVWHMAAAVGPYHPPELYHQVNYLGTKNVIQACHAHGVTKVVMSSSPSTRFDGSDIDGLTEAELPALPMRRYLQVYAQTKALGELAMRQACGGSGLLAVMVAPHQVYGPRDTLFLPNVLEAAGLGRLRIFGSGHNRICFTYVDNYCHGLIIAEQALYPGSPALGQFYIVTDGATHPHAEGYDYFWRALDKAAVGMGFASLHTRAHMPVWLLTLVAYACELFGWLTGMPLKLNRFAVRAATMHRWFRIDSARRDLRYEPIVPYDEGWRLTLDWFRENWLPKFDPAAGARIARQTRGKIDAQAQRPVT